MSDLNANEDAVVTDGDGDATNTNAVPVVPDGAAIATDGAVQGDGASVIDHVDPTGSPHVTEDPQIEFPPDDDTVGQFDMHDASRDALLEDSPRQYQAGDASFWNADDLLAAFPSEQARVQFQDDLATQIRRLNADLHLNADLGEGPSIVQLINEGNRTIAAIAELQEHKTDQEGSVDSFYNTERPAGGHMTRSQTKRLNFTPVSAAVLAENLRKNRFRRRMLRESEPLRQRLLQAFHFAADVNRRRWSEDAEGGQGHQDDQGDVEDPDGQDDQGDRDGDAEEHHLDDDGHEVEVAEDQREEGQPQGAAGGHIDDDRRSHRSSRSTQSLASTLDAAADPTVDEREKFARFLATAALLRSAKMSTKQTYEYVRGFLQDFTLETLDHAGYQILKDQRNKLLVYQETWQDHMASAISLAPFSPYYQKNPASLDAWIEQETRDYTKFDVPISLQVQELLSICLHFERVYLGGRLLNPSPAAVTETPPAFQDDGTRAQQRLSHIFTNVLSVSTPRSMAVNDMPNVIPVPLPHLQQSNEQTVLVDVNTPKLPDATGRDNTRCAASSDKSKSSPQEQDVAEKKTRRQGVMFKEPPIRPWYDSVMVTPPMGEPDPWLARKNLQYLQDMTVQRAQLHAGHTPGRVQLRRQRQCLQPQDQGAVPRQSAFERLGPRVGVPRQDPPPVQQGQGRRRQEPPPQQQPSSQQELSQQQPSHLQSQVLAGQRQQQHRPQQSRPRVPQPQQEPPRRPVTRQEVDAALDAALDDARADFEELQAHYARLDEEYWKQNRLLLSYSRQQRQTQDEQQANITQLVTGFAGALASAVKGGPGGGDGGGNDPPPGGGRGGGPPPPPPPPPNFNSGLKLPTIDLPKFGGDRLEFPGWYESYINLIHARPFLDSWQKQFILTKAILPNSRASEAVAGLADGCKQNYRELLLVLRRNFGSRRLLMSAIIKSLLGRPAAKNNEEARRFHDFSRGLLRRLENLGLNVEEPVVTTILITLLQAKLPSEIARSWERWVTARENENPVEEPPIEEPLPPMRMTHTVLQMLAFVDERLKSDALALQISLDHRQDGGQGGGGGGQGGQKKPQQQQQQSQQQQKNQSAPTMGTGQDGTSARQMKQMRQLKALIADHAEELLADVVLAAPGVAGSNSRGGQSTANVSSNKKNKNNKPKSGGGTAGASNPGQVKPATTDGAISSMTIKIDPKLEGVCVWCDQRGHSPFTCANLKSIPVQQRWEKLRQRWKTQTTCSRCLQDNHGSPACPLQKTCGVAGCGKAHATPLHVDSAGTGQQQAVTTCLALDNFEDITLASVVTPLAVPQTFDLPNGSLPSLLCDITGVRTDGKVAVVSGIRVVFDSASSTSFVTESLVERMGLERVEEGPALLSGITGTSLKKQFKFVSSKLAARISSFSLPCDLRLLPAICGPLPPVAFSWADFPEVPLDLTTEVLPRVEAANVDVLIGNDLLPSLVYQVVSTGSEIHALLWKSHLGVAIAGGANFVRRFYKVDNCTRSDNRTRSGDFVAPTDVPRRDFACRTRRPSSGNLSPTLFAAQLEPYGDSRVFAFNSGHGGQMAGEFPSDSITSPSSSCINDMVMQQPPACMGGRGDARPTAQIKTLQNEKSEIKKINAGDDERVPQTAATVANNSAVFVGKEETAAEGINVDASTAAVIPPSHL